LRQKGVQDGSYPQDSTCVSTGPSYIPYPPFNGTLGQEDCLFLDIYVPESVRSTDSVPVLHWLYGSAYAFGSKDYLSNPMGLFDQLLIDNRPFIFVTSNYRMGLYGWVSSPFQDMDANIGLEDGRKALEWTQRHISQFGGSPSDITAMGQSAGAGIVELLLAENKFRQIPFQRAVLSSSALPVKRNARSRREEVYQTMLNLANCSSLGCLKNLTEDELKGINRIMISDLPNYSGGGNFGPGIGFGPVVDGKSIHNLPSVLFEERELAGSLKGLIIGNMQNEVGVLLRLISMLTGSVRHLRCLLMRTCLKPFRHWSGVLFRRQQMLLLPDFRLYTGIPKTSQRSWPGTGQAMLYSSAMR
jgi:carboxylesterase type B